MGLSARLTVVKAKEMNVQPAHVVDRIEYITEQYAKELIADFQVYPNTRSEWYFPRSGRLHDEWRYSRSIAAGGISYRIINEATNPETGRQYASFVMGARQQPGAERLEWRKVSDIIDRKSLAAKIQAEIARALH